MDIPTTMCGSKDLIKKDGVYTCEYCGAKYTAEEAKKLMIEGTVDVSGSTVKADTSDELSNLYQLARRARANDDDATASKYYDMILLKAPNSWEAIFYSLYYKATQAKIDEVQAAIGPINNYGANIFGAIKIEITDKEEQKRAYMEVAIRMVLLSATAFSSAEKYFNIDRNRSGFGNIQRWINEAFTARQLSFIAGISLDNLFGEDNDAAELAVKALKQAIEQTQHMVGYLSDESKKAQREIVKEYTEKIQKYEPSYSPPPARAPAAMLPQPFTVPMIARRCGHCVVSATARWQKHGTDVLLLHILCRQPCARKVVWTYGMV